jgi:DNA polymerase-3 subunit alpha
MSSTPRDFVHLHVHSHFSLLDGVVKIPKLVSAAKECGMRALALTDHGNLFGAVQFYKKCKAEGVKPIIGMEAYVAPGSRLEKKRTTQGAFFHFTLLARDEEGYHNLMRLSSLAYIDGFYYKPRIDREILKTHGKGLIGMSACLSSEINRAAVNGTEDELRDRILAYRDIFEPNCFYLEIQRHGLPEQERILERIPPIAREYGIGLVATNDVHYLRRDDARAQEVHLCINTGQTVDDADALRLSGDQFYFRNAEEMYRTIGADFPDAMENTLEIAEKCNVELDFGKLHLPPFQVEDIRETSDECFRRLCEEGCRRHYPDFDTNETVQKRLEYEVGVIKSMDYINYFLIVHDFMSYARKNGIPVGPGRGSAAGSIVAFALGITNVCPLRYDLLFERFLNAERISMPDIDIDFCMDGRERVIDYVRKKYGEDRVSQIITFGTMAARAVLKDVGRALEIPLAEVNEITKKIPAGPGVKLQESLEADPDLVRIRDTDPRLSRFFDIALRLEGLNRHCSTHAAGVVIGDAPLIDLIPLYRNGDEITSQWTMEDLEAVGMLKMDFLGLRTLTIIDKCVKEVRRARGVDIDIDSISLADRATYELLSRGETIAVFQLESQGMRDLLRRLQPDRFEDIIALLALYRPGPLEGGMVDSFVERKHGREEIEYDHPSLQPILEETFGVILYQEQVMRIANQFAGFTLNEADTLRKAMGKKKLEIMQAYKAKFVAGAEALGRDPKLASHIFDLIEFFAGYGFNKSHSTAYALVTYQTAWLKANYPTEFIAAVLTCEMSSTEKVVEYLEEARTMGIAVVPPDVQRSRQGFSVEDGKIWYGLEAIKGLGGKVVEDMIAEREKKGPYRSIFDLSARNDVNRSVLETLVSSGALDSFGIARSRMVGVIDAALRRGAESRRDARVGQMSFFDIFETTAPSAKGESASAGEDYPELPEWPDAERLKREKQVLGFYLSGHPLEAHLSFVRKITRHSLDSVAKLSDTSPIVVAAQVSKLTKKVSKRTNEPFYIVLLEDLTGSQEVYVGKDLYERVSQHLVVDEIVMVFGKVHYRDTTPTLRVDNILPIERATEELTRDVGVVVAVDDERKAEDDLFRLKELLGRHRGSCPLFLVLRNSRGDRVILRAGTELSVRPERALFAELAALCGTENIFLNRMSKS